MTNDELEEIVSSLMFENEPLIENVLNSNREIEYLCKISQKINTNPMDTINYSLDIFNYYKKNNVDTHQSKKISLSKTYEMVMRTYLKNTKEDDYYEYDE